MLKKMMSYYSGGVLFIDEAYQFVTSTSGRQALDILLTMMENNAGRLAVIFASYHDDMEPLFEHNPGLLCRIPYTLQFDDFSDPELWRVLCDKIEDRYGGRMRVEEGIEGLWIHVAIRRLARSRKSKGFGNARSVENLLAAIAERQTTRIKVEYRRGEEPDLYYFTKEDLIGPDPTKADFTSRAWTQLQEIIRLDSAKASIKATIEIIKRNYGRELREEKPLQVSLNPGLARRFPIERAFRFENFDIDQLMQVMRLKMHQQDIRATDRALAVAHGVLERALMRPSFSNGGEVERCLADAKSNHEARQAKRPESEQEAGTLLEAEDFDLECGRLVDDAKSSCRDILEGLVDKSIIETLEKYQRLWRVAKQRGCDPRKLVPTRLFFKGGPGTCSHQSRSPPKAWGKSCSSMKCTILAAPVATAPRLSKRLSLSSTIRGIAIAWSSFSSASQNTLIFSWSSCLRCPGHFPDEAHLSRPYAFKPAST